MTGRRSCAATATSGLFVPGSSPDRFQQALRSDTDFIIIDLEDAVLPAARMQARRDIEAFLRQDVEPGRIVIRVNAVGTYDHPRDAALLHDLLREHPYLLAGVMVAKTESAQQIVGLRAALGGEDLFVVGLVETVVGYADARTIAAALAPNGRLAFGALDFAVDAGGDHPSLLDAVAVELIVASRLSRLPGPLASPTPVVGALDVVRAAANRAAHIGYAGMLAIHPRQLPAIHEAFSPSAEELAWAEAVLSPAVSAALVNGSMVDEPVRERARRVLAARPRNPRSPAEP